MALQSYVPKKSSFGYSLHQEKLHALFRDHLYWTDFFVASAAGLLQANEAM